MKHRLYILIRKIMLEQESRDGYTAKELAAMLNAPKVSILAALRKMPDAYIDRWTEWFRSKPAEAIWCIIVAPEDCPRPRKKY